MVSQTPVRWREPGYRFVGRPFFVHEAILKLEELIQPGWRVFEWGSGASTLWLGADMMVRHAVSVEHDREWYEKTRVELGRYFVADVELVHADLGGPYEKYIKSYPLGHFDLILVDGRNRADCLKYAPPHLKPGGLLVLDDSQRYQAALDWQRWDYVAQGGNEVGVRTTSIWQK